MHIDDTLIGCTDESVLTAFKTSVLTRFDGTDDGPVQQHLRCKVIQDREKRTMLIRQKGYSERILHLYGFWDKATVKTPMAPGVRLSKDDCPDVVKPVLHRRFRGIVGHLSFLVQMTRPDLAYSYAELSKFCQCPGLVHLQAAERVLQYLRGTYDQGITYFDPGPALRHKLGGWVDSDFAADPDTCRSVSGFILSMNGGLITWKCKRQSCTTLSSAEADLWLPVFVGRK